MDSNYYSSSYYWVRGVPSSGLSIMSFLYSTFFNGRKKNKVNFQIESSTLPLSRTLSRGKQRRSRMLYLHRNQVEEIRSSPLSRTVKKKKHSRYRLILVLLPKDVNRIRSTKRLLIERQKRKRKLGHHAGKPFLSHIKSIKELG